MAKSAVSGRKSATNDNMFVTTRKATEETPAPKKIKRTFHLSPEEVQLLNNLRHAGMDPDTKATPNLSDLVGKGIRLLAEQSDI